MVSGQTPRAKAAAAAAAPRAAAAAAAPTGAAAPTSAAASLTANELADLTLAGQSSESTPQLPPAPVPAAAPAPETPAEPPQRLRGKISYVAKSRKGYHGAIRYLGKRNGKRAWLDVHLRPEECLGQDEMPLGRFDPPASGQIVEFDVEPDEQGTRAVLVTGPGGTPVRLENDVMQS